MGQGAEIGHDKETRVNEVEGKRSREDDVEGDSEWK